MQKAILDFHIHSRFSRACSKELNFSNIAKWAHIKGINIIGSGDFTHPQWIKEFEEEMRDNGNGLYQLKNDEYNAVHFILSTVVSFIFKINEKVIIIDICILFSILVE